MDQLAKVVVVAPTFKSAFSIAFYDSLKKWLKPEAMAMRSMTDDPAIQKERLKQALIQANHTALIALDIRPDADIVFSYFKERVPIILIDEETQGASSISTDNITGGRLAGEYLAKKGRKKIAIVSGRTQVKGGYNAEQRLKGFRQALSVAGLTIPQGCLIEVPDYSREDGLSVMPELLKMNVDAVFCAAGDNCAMGLLTVAKERGIRVPDDVAIVGFDDLLIAQLSTPALTTIRQPFDKMAEAAYKMAVVNKEEILAKPQKAMFNPELVIRKSA